MKNYIKIATMFFIACACTFANAAQIELKQVVKNSGSKTVNLNYNNSYQKYKTVRKTFTVTVKSTSPIDVLIVLATLSGNEGVECSTKVANVNYKTPCELSAFAASESEETKLDFTYIPDYYSKQGNAKVDAVCYVYDLKTGKLLGSKFTSKIFADEFIKNAKPQIDKLLEKEMANLKANQENKK